MAMFLDANSFSDTFMLLWAIQGKSLKESVRRIFFSFCFEMPKALSIANIIYFFLSLFLGFIRFVMWKCLNLQEASTPKERKKCNKIGLHYKIV